MLPSNSVSSSSVKPKIPREVPSAITNVFPEITLQSKLDDITNAISSNPEKWGQLGFEISAEIGPSTTALNNHFLQITQGIFIRAIMTAIHMMESGDKISEGLISLVHAYNENPDNLRRFRAPKGTLEGSWNSMIDAVDGLSRVGTITADIKAATAQSLQGELFH